ncbi:hypothetical protein [Dyadobacter bucti]|jgi:hypothetical protein|uniref:hypothetical protein n=1 Tax=Dyadobacter bucti TaxID=2572203 RepID=UPI00110867DE|nr:hypothetical protein [Dyadobacter bucti]
MKKIVFLLINLVIFTGCKKDETETLYDQLVGKWQLLAAEHTENGVLTWQVRPFDEQDNLEFTSDGIANVKKDYGLCCAPEFLIVGGAPVKLKPKADRPSYNERCYYTCECPNWRVEISGDDEIIITYCETRFKYLRI